MALQDGGSCIQGPTEQLPGVPVHVCAHVCMSDYLHAHIYVHVCACTHTCMYMCGHRRAHVCACVCLHECV